MRALVLSSLILGVALVTVGCCGYCCHFVCNNNPKVKVEAREDLVMPVEGISELDVNTYNGYIHLTGDPMATEFRVDIEKKAYGMDKQEAQQCLENILIITDLEGDTQKLYWKWRNKDEARDRNWRGAVSFTIVMPANMETDCETYNGRVEITGVVGKSKITTYNGSIKMKDHEGDIDLETYNGQIDSSSLSSNFKVESYNGNVTTNLLGAATLDGKVTTYNGQINLNIDGQPSTRISAKLHNGRINPKNGFLKDELKKNRQYKGVIGSGEGKVYLESYNGSINIY